MSEIQALALVVGGDEEAHGLLESFQGAAETATAASLKRLSYVRRVAFTRSTL